MGLLGYLTWKNNTSARMARLCRINTRPVTDMAAWFVHNAGKWGLNPDGYGVFSA